MGLPRVMVVVSAPPVTLIASYADGQTYPSTKASTNLIPLPFDNYNICYHFTYSAYTKATNDKLVTWRSN